MGYLYLSFRHRSFQSVNCNIVGRVQSLQATIMKLAYCTLVCYVWHCLDHSMSAPVREQAVFGKPKSQFNLISDCTQSKDLIWDKVIGSDLLKSGIWVKVQRFRYQIVREPAAGMAFLSMSSPLQWKLAFLYMPALAQPMPDMRLVN